MTTWYQGNQIEWTACEDGFLVSWITPEGELCAGGKVFPSPFEAKRHAVQQIRDDGPDGRQERQ